jgi:hypothetical protein
MKKYPPKKDFLTKKADKFFIRPLALKLES